MRMATALPDTSLPWPVALAGVYEIAQSESLALTAYLCPAGIWTIGWGETDGVHPGDTCTKQEADRWLCEDITDRAKRIKAMCTVEPSSHQLAALVSLAYNIGIEALRGSTVMRQHNAANQLAAARAFGLWNKARNPRTKQLQVLAGLTARRARESALYLTPDDTQRAEPMPQAVVAESRLFASPIAQGGTVTAGAGALAGLSAVSEQLGQTSGLLHSTLASVKGLVTGVADFAGVPPGVLLAGALLLAGGMVLLHRWRQRAEGWA